MQAGKPIVKEFTVVQSPAHYDSAKRYKSDSLGLSVRDLTYEVRRYFQKPDDEPGIIVAKIEPGSRASVAGLKPFELITHVNNEAVPDVATFEKLVTTAKTELRLNVKRMTRGPHREDRSHGRGSRSKELIAGWRRIANGAPGVISRAITTDAPAVAGGRGKTAFISDPAQLECTWSDSEPIFRRISMRLGIAALLGVAVWCAPTSLAQQVYKLSPDWISTDHHVAPAGLRGY